MKEKNFIVKIISGVVILFSLVSGIWLMEDRYVNASELEKAKEKIYLRMDLQEYRELTKQYYDYRRLVNENPSDINLREQLNKIECERDKIKKDIDKALKNGK